MSKGLRLVLATFALAATTGCLGIRWPGTPGDARSQDPGVDRVIVIDGSELDTSMTVSLLAALGQRVAGLRVGRHGRAGCPSVDIGTRSTLTGTSDPAIYIDNIRSMDTCVLETLSAQDVLRVEVYRGGWSGDISHTPSPFGMIVVRTRRGA